MNELEYNLGNIIVVALTSAGVHFLPKIPGGLLIISTLLFQLITSYQYSRENTVKIEWHFLIVSCLFFAFSFWAPPNIYNSTIVAGGLVLTLFALSLFHKGEKDETTQAINEAVSEIREKMELQTSAIVAEMENQLKGSITTEEATKREAILREKLTNEQNQKISELEEQYSQKVAVLQSETDNKNEAKIQQIIKKKNIELNKIKEQTNQLINQYVREYKEKIAQKNKELELLKESNSSLRQENSDQKKLITEHENIILAQKEMLKELNLGISELNKELNETKSEKEKVEAENELLERNIKILNDREPEKYKKKKNDFQKKYKHINNPKVIDFISTGEIHYEMSKAIREGDYSAIVIEYAKSVETLFVDILKAKHLYKEGDEKLPLFNLMKAYIYNEKYSSTWDNEFKAKLNRLRKIRNLAAHKEALPYESAMELRTIVLGGGQTGIEKDGLIAYMDSILR